MQKLTRQVLNTEDSIFKLSDKVRVLKYHPLAMAILIKPCFFYVYVQSQVSAFRQLEQLIIEVVESQTKGVQIIYCDSQERGHRDSFELDSEYKGRLMKILLQPLGTLDFLRDRREREVNRQAAFPARLVDSRVLELFRTVLLSATEPENVAFVDEFLEDWIKVLVKSIDKDAALIRRLLKDKPANAQDNNEEEK